MKPSPIRFNTYFKVDRYTCKSDAPVLEAERPKRLVFQWTAGEIPRSRLRSTCATDCI
jgi:uncharacterized protein YndB with AHSA1/START domain